MEEHEVARLETENGFRQIAQGIEIIKYYLEPNRPFALRPGLILELQQIAIEGFLQILGSGGVLRFKSRKVYTNRPPHIWSKIS